MSGDQDRFDAAKVIAELLVTPSAQLESFRRAHFEGKTIPLSRLASARALCLAAASMLRREDGDEKLAAGLLALDVEGSPADAADALLEHIRRPETLPPMAPKVGHAPPVEIPPGAELPFDAPRSETEAQPVGPKVVDDTGDAEPPDIRTED